MKILQIAQSEQGGGASRVALSLHLGYLAAGHDARLMVKYPGSAIPGVYTLDAFSGTSPWAPICQWADRAVAHLSPFRGQGKLRDWLRMIAWPKRISDRWSGIEDFNYSYAHHLLDTKGWTPDVVQLHNISNNCFDLRALTALSRKVPVFMTMHDAWLITGHCAHPIDCERWRHGCGSCPDLHKSPAVRKDRTHDNWMTKKSIYQNSELHIIAVSNWLASLLPESILSSADARTIHNGIDTSIFAPGNKKEARKKLGLPLDAFICLFVSRFGSTGDAYKDYTTIGEAIDLLEADGTNSRLFVCVGGRKAPHSSDTRRYIGFIGDPQILALYYQAADVFLHAANAESFGLTLLEAQACGTPVVATAVGGIPETLEANVSGMLVPRQGSKEMADAIAVLQADPVMCKNMGTAGISRVRSHFDLRNQVQQYLAFYEVALRKQRRSEGDAEL